MNGKLKLKTPHKNTKYAEYVCDDCDTQFYSFAGIIKCNSHIIQLCPWCRPDSKKWHHGRGA